MVETRFISTEQIPQNPLLLIDKAGYVVKALLPSLAQEFFCVSVSSKEVVTSEQVLSIPFGKRIPLLPDSTYSHSIFVYKGDKHERAILPQVLRKALADGSVCVFVASIYTVNKKLIDMIQTENPKVRILLYADVFADKVIAGNSINRILHQVWTQKRIVLPQTGLSPTLPVYFGDIIASVLAAAFSGKSFHKLSLLFPKYPLTQLSIARICSMALPQIRIDFVKTKPAAPPPSYIPPDGVYILEPYDVATKLRDVVSTQPKEHSVDTSLFTKNRKPRTVRRLLIPLLLFMLTLPLLVPASLAVVGAGTLFVAKEALQKDDIPKASQYAEVSHATFSNAATIAESIAQKLPIMFMKQPFVRLASLSEQGAVFSSLALDASEVHRKAKLVFFGSSQASLDQAKEAINSLKQLILKLRVLKLEGTLPQSMATTLAQYEQEMDLFLAVSDTIPDLAGFTQKKTYLVLFQNSFELRPGGGFIGSYGLATLDHGKLVTFSIHDVYDADGKLKGHLEPPFGLRRYLGASHWFLRDSNYAVDFRTNAAQAASFLDLETGEKVDGVIGIDTMFLQSLLRVTGPILLPDYKTTVNAENVFTTFEHASQDNFFPGSTQKRDFLSSVNTALRDRLQKGDLPLTVLANELTKALFEKHLQIVVNNTTTQKLLTVNKLSGSIQDTRRKEGNTILDTFGLSESNVGQNKSNYYLTRSIDHAVRVGVKGEVEESVKITYTNKSTETSAFGGAYKMYLRLLVPFGAKIRSVKLDGEEENIVPAVTDPAVFTKKTFVVPQGFEIEESTEQGKQLFGFLVSIPTSATRTVEVSYVLADSVSLADPLLEYSLQVIKQPGTAKDPYRFSLSVPSIYHMLKSSAQVEKVGNRINYTTTLLEDRTLNASFSQ